MTEDDTLERIAIAGATAIQHIIAERNDLRNCTHVQQQELVALRAVNEELRVSDCVGPPSVHCLCQGNHRSFREI